jgi:uncharacterized protein (DUF58 family)
VPVAAGAWSPVVAWAGLAALLALVAAAAADWAALPRARDFDVSRAAKPILPLAADDTIEVLVRLASRGPVNVRVSADLPDGVERVSDPREATLDSGARATFGTRVRAMRRGAFALSLVHVRARSRWGLAECEIAFDLPAEVRVPPGARAASQAAQLLRTGRRREAGVRRSRRRGEGTSFESLREYVRGEDPRRIDWKASAKHAKLIARHYEVERNQSLILLVDCGRWMTAEVGGLTRLDHVLESCVMLAHAAARMDDRVGLLAFADEVLAWVPPAKGRAAVEAIREATIRIEPRLVESDYVAAFTYLASRHGKRSLVVLFTDVLSREASRDVVAECARAVRRHLPLAVTLRDDDLDAAAAEVPLNAAAAYRQAAGEDLLLEREQALAAMRAAGVRVVDVSPRALSPALLETYLDVKSHLLV